MADILLDGLPVLDLLEIAPSTSAVAQIIQRDQSSISRIYRQVSGRLGLEFRKHANGLYGAGSNQSLLKGLRLSSQWLRLQSAPPEPRWLASGSVGLDGNGAHPALPAGLLQRCRDHQRVYQLLQDRVLDLAVISQANTPTPLPEALVERPLLRSPSGVDILVLRMDLEQQPAMAALITTLHEAYRQHALHNPQPDELG
jgi:hypothetical protein